MPHPTPENKTPVSKAVEKFGIRKKNKQIPVNIRGIINQEFNPDTGETVTIGPIEQWGKERNPKVIKKLDFSEALPDEQNDQQAAQERYDAILSVVEANDNKIDELVIGLGFLGEEITLIEYRINSATACINIAFYEDFILKLRSCGATFKQLMELAGKMDTLKDNILKEIKDFQANKNTCSDLYAKLIEIHESYVNFLSLLRMDCSDWANYIEQQMIKLMGKLNANQVLADMVDQLTKENDKIYFWINPWAEVYYNDTDGANPANCLPKALNDLNKHEEQTSKALSTNKSYCGNLRFNRL